MKKRGYLLVEMMIAITTLAMTALIMANIQARIAGWHIEAEQYLVATNIAQRTLMGLQQAMPWTYAKNDFGVRIATWTEPAIPFTAYTITVSFVTPRGITREVVIGGGRCHAKK